MTDKKNLSFIKKQQIANKRNEHLEDSIIFVLLKTFFPFIYRFENLSNSETHRKSSKNSLRINPPSTYNVFLSFEKKCFTRFLPTSAVK